MISTGARKADLSFIAPVSLHRRVGDVVDLAMVDATIYCAR